MKKKNSKILQVCRELVKFLLHETFPRCISSLRVRHTRLGSRVAERKKKKKRKKKEERKSGNARYKNVIAIQVSFPRRVRVPRSSFLSIDCRSSVYCRVGVMHIANTRFPLSRSIPRSRFIMQHALQLFAQYPGKCRG